MQLNLLFDRPSPSRGEEGPLCLACSGATTLTAGYGSQPNVWQCVQCGCRRFEWAPIVRRGKYLAAADKNCSNARLSGSKESHPAKVALLVIDSDLARPDCPDTGETFPTKESTDVTCTPS